MTDAPTEAQAAADHLAARYDDQAWTQARIQESATETGTYALLEKVGT